MSSSVKRSATKAMQTGLRTYFRRVLRSHLRPFELLAPEGGQLRPQALYLSDNDQHMLGLLLRKAPDEVSPQDTDTINGLVSKSYISGAGAKVNDQLAADQNPALETDLGKRIKQLSIDYGVDVIWQKAYEGAKEYHDRNPSPDRLAPWKLFLEYSRMCKSMDSLLQAKR